jgi:hypothetical protein
MTAFLDALEGLVPLYLIRFEAQPLELARAFAESDSAADILAESGDRLTAPGNFTGAEERDRRGEALSATARALALGALQPGGVTWSGRHWCTQPHPDCPNRNP